MYYKAYLLKQKINNAKLLMTERYHKRMKAQFWRVDVSPAEKKSLWRLFRPGETWKEYLGFRPSLCPYVCMCARFSLLKSNYEIIHKTLPRRIKCPTKIRFWARWCRDELVFARNNNARTLDLALIIASAERLFKACVGRGWFNEMEQPAIKAMASFKSTNKLMSRSNVE